MGSDRFKHRRQASGLMGAAFDEVFHPDAKEARLVWELEQELPVEIENSEDSPYIDLENNKIVISLS